MDIKKLQRVIVDGLQDVKAQDIVVFDTEHLTSMFERVVVASGTSNRQTKALASSVRDAVKDSGEPIPRTEGEENGEWIIVDCGAAVVHIMQPVIRQYYNLEEIWGEKPVKLKLTSSRTGLVKASEEPDSEAESEAAAPERSTVATKKVATKKVASKKTSDKKTIAVTTQSKAPPRKTASKKTAARKVSAKKAV
jgi:ribosome-associated protein